MADIRSVAAGRSCRAETRESVIFNPLPIDGVHVVELAPHEDERGWFARTYCDDTFVQRGLRPVGRQCNAAFNRRAGTLRGMHYQAAPHGETKLVRVTSGAVYDVVLDLRPDSRMFRRWHAVELTAANRLALYIPEGCAHGYQTLVDDTEVFYQVDEPFVAAAGRGVRWDDPSFAIRWPGPVTCISSRDAQYPDFVW